MSYYDTVRRVVRHKGGIKTKIYVPRYQCKTCHIIRRELPENVYPFKQYEAEIIDGVLEGFISSDAIGFEDYPSEMTMKRWRTQLSH